jgi:ANTAR domain-containing protein
MSTDDSREDALSESEQERISAAVQAIIGQRALIEQAKGMLMFVYGIDADAAFEVLRQQSQQHNVKLRLIAEQISKDLVEVSQAGRPVGRLALDEVLLTGHQRIANVAARQMDGQSKTDA